MAGRILIVLLISFAAHAQGDLQIKLLDNEAQSVADARVELPGQGRVGYTRSDGRVRFPLQQSAYPVRVIVHSADHALLDTLLPSTTPGRGEHTLTLRTATTQLGEVVVNGYASPGNTRALNMIEGTAIYAGKKSEILRPGVQPVNLATNNAREIFATATGMNVWEGDESGIQLNIGGRGLNPNRASNFNVRQNGYDISPDALGYPESYYTPPAEAVRRISIVKGAASLQYGTQFGGLINFEMKEAPKHGGWELINRTTGGSFGLFNQFTSYGWRGNKTGAFAYVNYRRGNGWRPNSHFESGNAYLQMDWKLSKKSILKAEYTHLSYLAQQPGGLDDQMFVDDPQQSNRSRNWFGLNWNILALRYALQIGNRAELNLRLYGLYADRNALGFRNYRPAAEDPGNTARELITGKFRNAGFEARYLQRYSIGEASAATLIGLRLYGARNSSRQGLGSTASDADFRFIDSPENLQSAYDYPNDNAALFVEQLFTLGNRWTFTPGMRAEYINSRSDGYYRVVERDLAGNIILNETYPGGLARERGFLLFGMGAEYRATEDVSVYFNATQNFRAITYSDIHIANPSFAIDPGIEDERGFSVDLGVRRHSGEHWQFDVSAFVLNYNNRIGEVARIDSQAMRLVSYRTNIGQALVYGLESYVRWGFWQPVGRADRQASVFLNATTMNSAYLKSALSHVVGNEVEFAPRLNVKAGLEGRFSAWSARIQGTGLSRQYSDAANDENGGAAAVTGIIPAFVVFDAGITWTHRRFRVEFGINNLLNRSYFTRRATGYPGPGIIPSPGRSVYLGVQVRLGG